MASVSTSEQEQPSSTATRLRALRERIQTEWLQKLRETLPHAASEAEPILLNNVPELLEFLALLLESASLGTYDGRADQLFMRHADMRLNWSSYSAEELMREYATLRKVVLSRLEEDRPLALAERDVVLEFIDEGIRVASARFSELQRFHQRLEMQYLKLIEHLVAETGNIQGIEDGLQRLLDVVLREIGAEAAAFLLYHEDTLELRLSSAAAPSRQLADLYRGALSLSRLTAFKDGEMEGEMDSAVRVLEVSQLEPEVQQALTELRITCLVSVKLRAHDRLPGALCIGFHESRSLDPAELHLLEVLGERLALLLASIELNQQSKAALDRAQRESTMVEAERNKLDDERKQRDQLISALSHDLKTPLHTAKLGAELIRRGPATASATERLAGQILKSITRSDEMIHDLLEAQRFRAGKRRPLKLDLFPMNALLSEVVQEMTELHGDRFSIHATKNVQGYWSWSGMRRAIENLLTNAVKYAEPGTPITIDLNETDEGRMVLSVHNHGPALSEEEQARIFDPFERGREALRGSKPGWGIGLTLVNGIVTSHGGNVRVESSPDGGTKFTIDNPMDSRSAQQQSNEEASNGSAGQ